VIDSGRVFAVLKRTPSQECLFCRASRVPSNSFLTPNHLDHIDTKLLISPQLGAENKSAIEGAHIPVQTSSLYNVC